MSEKAKKYKELTKSLEPGGSSIQEIPRGPVAKFIGDDVSKAVRTVRDKMSGKIPLIDMTVGEVLVGQAPEALEDWSYGNGPVRFGRTDVQGPAGALYGMKVDDRVLDVFGAAEIPYLVGKAGVRGAIRAAEKMAKPSPAKAADEIEALARKYGGPVKMAGGGRAGAFFSAIDKAIDVLKQKKGTGEQILKEIEKAPGVKKEELELRKIPEKLKGKPSITQEEVKKLASESPAPKVKAIEKKNTGVSVNDDWQPNLTAEKQADLDALGIVPVVEPGERRMLGFMIEETGDIVDYDTMFTMKPEDFGTTKEIYNNAMAAARTANQQFNAAISQAQAKSAPKFERYTTPGGENYREILLQMERPRGSAQEVLGGTPQELTRKEAAEKIGMYEDDFSEGSTILYYPYGTYVEKLPDGRYMAVVENSDKISNNLADVEEFIVNRMGSELRGPSTANAFRGGHFDEPDVLTHVRVTDRKGPNGEKVLYVEEIQSDWHQQARKARDSLIDSKLEAEKDAIREKATDVMRSIGRLDMTDKNYDMREGIINQLTKARRAEIAKEVPKDAGYSKPLTEFQGMAADDLLWAHGDQLDNTQKKWLRDYIERWELDVDGSPAGQTAQELLVKEYDDWLASNFTKGIPDAPWKNTSNELAVKQIMDIAAKEGYDTVAFSPGSEHVKRYGMSQYFDTLTAEKMDNGKINLIGTKGGTKVVERNVDPDELPDFIGKEKAENIMEQLKRPPPKNEAAEQLNEYIGQLQKKYDQDFPTYLRDKATPEEVEKWDRLLELSNVWDAGNRDIKGRMPKNQAVLSGQELELTTAEGAGKKKIYDEIIPNYVRKYAKKEFGAEPGEIDIPIGKGGKTYEQYLDEINADPYQHFDEDTIFDELHERVMDKANVKGYDFKGQDADDLWDQMMSREGPFEEIWHEAEQDMYRAKAKELAEQDPGQKLRAFSVPVTPQMREKITSQGQPLFSVAPPAALGATQAIPQKEEPAPEPEAEEAPQAFERGGRAEDEDARRLIEEAPYVQSVLNAARHYQGGKEIENAQVGVRKGPFSAGINAANIRDPGTRDAMQAQALFAAYQDRFGDVGVNASINKPSQTPPGFYHGNVMASMPVGEGRVMGGVSGYRTPEKSDISGYNAGYERKIGPGYASGMVFQPKDRRQDTRYEVQYNIPFASGGPVGYQGGGRVGMAKAAAEKLMRVLHGSPGNVVPEAGRAMDVTTDAGYAVKRGSDKMLGKSGPPMVNKFDIPESRLLKFEEQYSPEDVALMKRFFNKLPEGQTMRGDEIWDAAQGRDVIMEGIAKAGGFAGYERPNTGAVGKGQWFRITEPEELKRGKKRGGLAQASKPL